MAGVVKLFGGSLAEASAWHQQAFLATLSIKLKVVEWTELTVLALLASVVECSSFFCLFFKSQPPYQVEKKGGGRLMCQKREFAARWSSCEVKFKDSKFKHEIFI